MKAFVCGWPVDHSKSPLIHTHWLEQHGIAGSYEKIAVTPEAFPQFIKDLRKNGYAGGNITLPHKEAALKLIGDLDDAARQIGAVNTVWFEGNSLVGGNTDWIGFVANLDETAPDWSSTGKTALVIGAGGASRAILYAIQQRKFNNIILANRTVEKAEMLAAEFGTTIQPVALSDVPASMAKADLVVNTSSMGMTGGAPFPSLILDSLADLKADALVTDIVYTPLETALLAAARKSGKRTVDGLGMLLHQAVPGFERWFGVRPQVTDELRRKILAGMGLSS